MALAVVVSMSGCGSSTDAAPATVAQAAQKVRKAVTQAQPDMVAAVSASKAPGPVDLRFELTRRPLVGQPTTIEFALTPAVELDGLYARFQGTDELQLVQGEETKHFERPPVGVPIKHTVTVIAKADGIFPVTAVVLTDPTVQSVARTYSVPVIAGAGLPELPEDAAGTAAGAAPPPAGP
jgi:hypothetical protein